METILAPQAIQDLREISDFIAKENPMRASSFVKELMQSCKDLKNMPRGYPRFEGISIPHLYVKNYKNYKIFYSIEEDAIFITRILHAARDLNIIFGEDDA